MNSKNGTFIAPNAKLRVNEILCKLDKRRTFCFLIAVHRNQKKEKKKKKKASTRLTICQCMEAKTNIITAQTLNAFLFTLKRSKQKAQVLNVVLAIQQW